MSNKVIVLYKEYGQTPLECLNRWKDTRKDLLNTRMTYAGRLDPLATGVLIALVGDEVLKKEEYLSLSKEYELTILFGFSTDTYDLLGKIKEVGLPNFKKEEVENNLKNFVGRIDQSYPAYSSRTVKGKPLFEWARSDRMNEIEIPKHKVTVENIEIINWGEITKKDLKERVENATSIVKGDFRQKEILDLWGKELEDSLLDNFLTLKIRISCGSGFYARVLAYELGQASGTPSLALDINRTKVGDYTI